MTVWMLACLGLVPPLAGAALASSRGPIAARLVAFQLMTTIAIFLLAAMTFAFDQPALIDLALALALLGLPGSVLFAIFVERWL